MIFFLLASLFPLVNQMEKELPNEVELHMRHSSQKLLDATHRYIDFINRISKGEDFAQMDVAATLLAPDCKKIFNGTIFTKTREEFVNDLLQVYRTHGSWHIRPVDIILSSEGNASVMRLFVDLEKIGHFTEMVILRFNAQGLMEELNIVLNKIEDAYHFDEGKQ